MPQHTNAPSSGEHPGKTPPHDDDRDDDEAPTTPTNEPAPIPVQDPPSDERPRPPLTVYPLLFQGATFEQLSA